MVMWRGRQSWGADLPAMFFRLLFVVLLVSADRGGPKFGGKRGDDNDGSSDPGFLFKAVNFLWQSDGTGDQHVWPEMRLGWRIILGTVIGFFGAAFGSVAGVGGGGFFVPMLRLIIGFDPKSSTAISKCMIMGAAASTVYYNLRLKHPTINMPIIDYDLALLIQPMLILGISIGVAFNVVFADWMVTVLLIILFIGTATKAFFKGVETWKKETLTMKAAKTADSISDGPSGVDYKPLPSGPNQVTKEPEGTILDNIYWKELGLLVFVWAAFLVLQITKTHTSTCSILYWVVNLLQIPISVGVSLYEAVSLYKGKRVIASKGDQGTDFKVIQLATYCFLGVMAGVVGGLLGVGGGSIMGPLFLELGVPPQVSSATATFAMIFSSSMSVVEYYLLKRFPIPYALYFVIVAIVSALVGQHIVRKLIHFLRRASLVIFILAFTIFISGFSLGGIGISNIIGKIQRDEYMGFDNLCKYDA